MVKGLRTCEICGRDFPLLVEDHYIARDDEKTGVVTAFSGEESKIYDAIDCPHCGSQNILQRRMREYTPERDVEPEREWCGDCKYEWTPCGEEPCVGCMYCYEDKFEQKEEEKKE